MLSPRDYVDFGLATGQALHVGKGNSVTVDDTKFVRGHLHCRRLPCIGLLAEHGVNRKPPQMRYRADRLELCHLSSCSQFCPNRVLPTGECDRPLLARIRPVRSHAVFMRGNRYLFSARRPALSAPGQRSRRRLAIFVLNSEVFTLGATPGSTLGGASCDRK